MNTVEVRMSDECACCGGARLAGRGGAGARIIHHVESSARGADTANQSGTLITAPVFSCHYTISDAAALLHVLPSHQLRLPAGLNTTYTPLRYCLGTF